MTHNSTWKDVERAIARKLGGQRVSNAGLGHPVADVEAGALSVEVKTRKALPGWLMAAVAQGRDNARAGRLGITVLHQVGQRHDNDLVVLRLSDFVDYFGDDWGGDEDGQDD